MFERTAFANKLLLSSEQKCQCRQYIHTQIHGHVEIFELSFTRLHLSEKIGKKMPFVFSQQHGHVLQHSPRCSTMFVKKQSSVNELL